MNKIFKFLFLVVLLTLTACGGEEGVIQNSVDNEEKNGVYADVEWTIYWYLCGSDLESSSSYNCREGQNINIEIGS